MGKLQAETSASAKALTQRRWEGQTQRYCRGRATGRVGLCEKLLPDGGVTAASKAARSLWNLSSSREGYCSVPGRRVLWLIWNLRKISVTAVCRTLCGQGRNRHRSVPGERPPGPQCQRGGVAALGEQGGSR